MTDNDFNFGRASQSEKIVFGAERPGHEYKSVRSVNESTVREWIFFMKDKGIKRVCCLLPKEQLDYYKENLLDIYRKEFGECNVCPTPFQSVFIEDFHLCDEKMLVKEILPFLEESDTKKEMVVVHCSGGSGRTGHVLVAWLVYGRGFSIEDALSAVIKMGRDPHEAEKCRNATPEELKALLEACKKH